MLWVYLDGNHEKGGVPSSWHLCPLAARTLSGVQCGQVRGAHPGWGGTVGRALISTESQGDRRGTRGFTSPLEPHGKGLQGHRGAFWLVLAVWAWLGGGPWGHGHEGEGSAGAPHVGSRVHSQEISPGHPETKAPGGKCPGVNPEHPGPHGEGAGSSQRGELLGPLNVLTPLLQKKGGVSGWGGGLHHPSR